MIGVRHFRISATASGNITGGSAYDAARVRRLSMANKPLPKLKPCPFCGREEPVISYGLDYGYAYACVRCRCFGPASMKKDIAVKSWNKRAKI